MADLAGFRAHALLGVFSDRADALVQYALDAAEERDPYGTAAGDDIYVLAAHILALVPVMSDVADGGLHARAQISQVVDKVNDTRVTPLFDSPFAAWVNSTSWGAMYWASRQTRPDHVIPAFVI